MTTSNKGRLSLAATFSGSLEQKYSVNEPVFRVTCLEQPISIHPLGDPKTGLTVYESSGGDSGELSCH